jgi:hypothetical protein
MPLLPCSMATIPPASLVLPTNLRGFFAARSLLLDFGPDGLLFQLGAVRATVPFDRAAVANLSALALYRLDEARLAWEPVPGGAVIGTTAFVAPLAHFSRYVLLELVEPHWSLSSVATQPDVNASAGSPVPVYSAGQWEWAGARQVWAEGVAAVVLLSAVFVFSLSANTLALALWPAASSCSDGKQAAPALILDLTCQPPLPAGYGMRGILPTQNGRLGTVEKAVQHENGRYIGCNTISGNNSNLTPAARGGEVWAAARLSVTAGAPVRAAAEPPPAPAAAWLTSDQGEGRRHAAAQVQSNQTVQDRTVSTASGSGDRQLRALIGAGATGRVGLPPEDTTLRLPGMVVPNRTPRRGPRDDPHRGPWSTPKATIRDTGLAGTSRK